MCDISVWTSITYLVIPNEIFNLSKWYINSQVMSSTQYIQGRGLFENIIVIIRVANALQVNDAIKG